MQQIAIPENRLKHCYTVGKVMQWCADYLGYDSDEQVRMFMIGYCHDCMYDFEDDGVGTHDVVCADALGDNSMQYAIRNHMLLPIEAERTAHEHYKGLTPDVPIELVELFVLRFADEIVDGAGNIVGFDKRINDLVERHGLDDGIVQEALHINNHLFAWGAKGLEKAILNASSIS